MLLKIGEDRRDSMNVFSKPKNNKNLQDRRKKENRRKKNKNRVPNQYHKSVSQEGNIKVLFQVVLGVKTENCDPWRRFVF